MRRPVRPPPPRPPPPAGPRGRRRSRRRPSQRSAHPPGARPGRYGSRGSSAAPPPSMLAGALPARRSVDRMPTDPPATLAAWLRTRSDEQLSALLAARPDVARPAPSDVVALASRLAVPVSVDRALDELDAATLQVLDVVLLAPTDGVAPDAIVAALPDVPDDVARGRPGAAHHPRAAVGRRRPARPRPGAPRRPPSRRAGPPGDRAAPAAARRPAAGVLAELDAEERAVLERLAGERPVGHLPDTPSDGGRTPAGGCCSAACSPASTPSTSSCPGRSGCTCAATAPTARPGCGPSPPSPRTSRARSTGARPARRWRASAGSASCSTLLEEEPAGLLRSGGVGVRDQKRLARELHVGEPDAAWLLELAYAAGLLDVGGPHRDEWLPTRAYDIWREQDLADRWATSPPGWLAGVRLPSLVGQRDVAGKAVNPLSPDLVRHTAPAIRRSALTVLAEYPPGAGLPPTTWSPCCAGAPRAGPTGSRRCRRCSPRPPASGSSSAASCRRPGRGLLAPRRGRRGRRHPRAAARAGRPRPRPARPLAGRPRAAGLRARRHPRGGRRRRVLRRGDGLPGVGGQRPAGAGPRLVGVGPARLLRPRLPHAGAAGAGLPGRRRRPPARAAAGRLDRVLRPLRRPRPALPGAQRPPAPPGRAAPARPGVLVSGLGADEVLTGAPRGRLRPGRGEPGRRRPHPAAARPRAAGRRPGSEPRPPPAR